MPVGVFIFRLPIDSADETGRSHPGSPIAEFRRDFEPTLHPLPARPGEVGHCGRFCPSRSEPFHGKNRPESRKITPLPGAGEAGNVSGGRYFCEETACRGIFLPISFIFVAHIRMKESAMKDTLARLYRQWAGVPPADVLPLTGAGSNRRYFRLAGERGTAVGVVGTSVEENRAFLAVAGQLAARKIRVPRVLAVSADGLCYLQTDLGSVSLYDKIAACRAAGVWEEETKALLRQVMTDLPAIQFLGAQGFDFSVCTPQQAFDRRTVMWDLNYFKYCFLKTTGIDYLEDRLEEDFRTLADDLLEGESATFMYRDFQSRNVMVSGGQPYYIDFQGGRRGPIYYDIASFLWQARAAFPDTLREELLACYRQSLARYLPAVGEAEFRQRLSLFVLFRLMQVLGAYGFRGYFERKAMFVTTIPAAVAELAALLERKAFGRYPYLVSILRQMVALPRFAVSAEAGGLVVKVMSFSYKKGIPDDYSGNGGGFVFDCRAPHNPGRYDAYKRLTGLDEPVIRFLEEQGEMGGFMEHVYGLVDPAVRRYVERGFTSLMVCFGCTGGQHRSVYAAQHLAEHVAAKFGVRVELTHREQGITQLFEAADR